MRPLLLFVLVAACLVLTVSGQPPAPDKLPAAVPEKVWKTATELPNVDMSGLSADKKSAVLKLLREENCTCGCGYKMAQCRLQDPKCAFSRMSANAAVTAIKDGRSPDQIRAAALAENHLKLLDDPVKIKVDGAASRGPLTAKVVLVEFSDFQCPYCSKAAFALDEIVRKYPADVRLVYKHYPIPIIHSQALLAAHAAVAANLQGKFWVMHDKMFNNGTKLTRENIDSWATNFSMDMPRFLKDLDSKETAAIVEKDQKEADDIGVLGTPTLFVNGKHFNGAITVADLTPIIDSELKK